MARRYVIFATLFILLTGFLSFRVTHSFFADAAQTTNNTFTAAAQFPTPTPTPIAAGDVVINEINWAGSNGDGNDEWIELKNMTSHAVNIGNWVVENLGTGSGPGANTTIPSGHTIPANGFFLISQATNSASKINVAPDFTSTSIALSNGGEQLILRTSSSGTIIDTANGSGAWFAGSNATPKKSMERKNPPSDGTVTGNWQSAITHTNMDASGATDEFGTPKAENGL